MTSGSDGRTVSKTGQGKYLAMNSALTVLPAFPILSPWGSVTNLPLFLVFLSTSISAPNSVSFVCNFDSLMWLDNFLFIFFYLKKFFRAQVGEGAGGKERE